MGKTLESIMNGLSEVVLTGISEPTVDISENEEIIGEMSDMQKKLYTLSAAYTAKSKILGSIGTAKILYSTVEMCRERLIDEMSKDISIRKAFIYERTADAIHRLLWLDMQEECGSERFVIGIRKGFKIVTLKDMESQIAGGLAEREV